MKISPRNLKLSWNNKNFVKVDLKKLIEDADTKLISEDLSKNTSAPLIFLFDKNF